MRSPWIFILIGLFTTICTVTKPNFYWNSRKAQRLRRVIGDTGAMVFYLAIGVFALFIGIKGYI